MLRSLTFLSLAAAFTLANAQAPVSALDPVTQATSETSQQPAPIVRRYQANGTAMHRPGNQQRQIIDAQPISGVWLRSESTSVLTTLSSTPQRTEIRLDHGRLNVTVHQPAQHAEILIDLPGGQTSLLKDGLYTFNADTNTVRVLHGEAAYVGPVASGTDETIKPIKIKEDHQLSLIATTAGKSELKSVEAYPYELTADLLPPDNHGEPGYPRYAGDYPYEYPYPYYAGTWGYPYGYGFYPGYYGYGYPYSYGIGIGIGYYGGFGGYHHGGFRR